jgi:NTE family protein
MSIKGIQAQNNPKQGIKSPKTQRTLVLQGGAALGAYETGVYRVLYDWISRHVKEEENIFDIIAGTSIGAINSAILLNHVLERRRKDPTITHKQSWAGSADKLERFWEDTSTQTFAEGAEFENWWNWLSYTRSWLNWINPLRGSLHNSNASLEAARRHYSVKQIKETGATNVFSLSSVDADTRFFDQMPDNPSWCWPHYSNEPLKNIVKSVTYWNGSGIPIKTKFENGEPRLLVVSIDVEAGATVTFDSYGMIQRDANNKIANNGRGEIEYSYQTEYYDSEGKLIIKYPEGIKAEHIIASASVPINYPYATFIAERENTKKELPRFFWDGQYISSTPLRELINAHQKFWIDRTDSKYLDYKLFLSSNGKHENKMVPDLDVYVANVWPTEENGAPTDHDGQLDRKNDIIFHDKTEYEEKVNNLVSDYFDLTWSLLSLLKKKGITEKELNDIFNKKGVSKSRGGTRRQYKEIINGGFGLRRVVRIEKTNDPDAISEAWCDYSKETISRLYDQGRKDTLKALLNNLQDAIDHRAESTDVLKGRLKYPLMKAEQVLSQGYNLSYYDNIWTQLDNFIKEVNTLEAEGKAGGGLSSEQAALFRP